MAGTKEKQEIDREYILNRNKKLLAHKDSCCEYGKKMLEGIEASSQFKGLDTMFTPFHKHAGDCSACRHVLASTNKEIRNEMGY